MAELTNYAKPYLSQLETGKRAVQPGHLAAYEQALGHRIVAPESIDSTDVHLMSQSTGTLIALGLRHGGMAVAEMATAQWGWASRLLDGSMRDGVRNALQTEAGYLADRVAWSLADAGRVDAAVKLYSTALELSENDPDLKSLVAIDLAEYNADHGNPKLALDILCDLPSGATVLRFSALTVRAHAAAWTGDKKSCIRYIGEADEAYAAIDHDDLPIWNRPYVSGRFAHADTAAGKALYRLAQHDRSVTADAAERLERAISRLGPDRARAAARSAARLAELAK